ncbi:eukaryotic translation initiation factor 2 subunit 2 [Microplitis mediator]|uniref:eukaryotic translation initiation factor 2 subunit 2 n=1 Tax=Microplitis demolitor TaxID=69319 RepID=UPI0004CCD372|nr:eukaryotic translation initiation factor 2 subunit 2 [Microplitis demolitor]XP_057336192.1 eukaryotic translation initiation factor 2 subunit 2 [Microplitis mediator]
MEEEDSIFDPTLKKKKKKKKTTFDLDAAIVEGGSGNEGNDGVPDKENQEPEQQLPEDDDALDLENFGKKKKKKKKTFNLDDGDNAASENKKEDAMESRTEEVAADDNLDLDMDFSKTKKKKKSKKKDFDELVAKEDKKESDDKDNVEDTSLWVGSDRDYTYDELLLRVFNIMREKNPDMVAGKKQKFVMRPPQVVRIGTKKSSFANFTEICKTLHRQPKHLLDFLLAELGTSGSVDGNSQLIIKGRFQQKQIENVLRRYIKEYVTCHTCRSPDTILQKDTRLFFLQCETCGSRCSVASIKSGFQAVTGKRAAIRAKTA